MNPEQGVREFINLAPISLNSAAGTTITCDTLGYNYAVVSVVLGVVGGAATVLKMTESDDNVSYRDIDATVASTTTVATGSTGNNRLPQTGDAGTIVRKFYIPLGGRRRRYLKPEITTGATTLVSITTRLYNGNQEPDTNTERNVATAIILDN